LAASIFGERRFKFVQIKFLGSCMAPPQGLKLLHRDMLKISLSRTVALNGRVFGMEYP